MSLASPLKVPVVETSVRPARVRAVQRRIDDDSEQYSIAGKRCACGGSCPTCQAKSATPLSISTPGDNFEREADRAADTVTSTLHGRSAIQVVPSITSFAPAPQTATSSASTNDGTVMRSEDSSCASDGMHSFATRLDAAYSRGQQLTTETRARMEGGFGADFGSVRIHTDPGANELARDAGARAFTTGNDIYFRSGEYQPGTSAGDWLLAHELTHVVQQRTSPTATVHRVQRMPTLAEAWSGVRATVRSGAAAVRETVSTGADAVREAAGTVRDVAVDVARSARDLVEGYLEEHAPGVLAFLRGDLVGEIRQRIYQGLDYLFNGLGQRIQADGLGETARAVFGEFVQGVNQVATDLASGRCESLFAAMRMIGAFGERLTGPAFRELREVAHTVGSFFNDIWTRFGAPVTDAIQSLAGGAWDWITAKAQWLWDQTEGVRRWFSEAWEEYKRRFNLAWDNSVSVLNSLRQKAAEAWEQIKHELGPWLLPLQIAAGALLLISPLGPIVAIGAGGYALWEAIGWIRAHWDDIEQMVVTARQYLHDHVLARIMRDLNWLQGMLGRAREWLTEQTASLVSALASLIDALGLTQMLNALRRVVGGIARSVSRAVQFLSMQVSRLFAELGRIAAEVHRVVRPFYGLIAAVILFPQYPFVLPVVLTGWAWRLSPDCIKPPIIDFALDMIIRGVRAVPEFRNFGDAWAQAKVHIVRSLERARGMDFEEKVRVSNRVARIMTGEDIDWIGNLIEAARNFPQHFAGQAQEELTGMNLGNPLPFERNAAPAVTAEVDPQAAVAAALAQIRTGPRLADGDITVDRVARTPLEPEVQQELLNLGAQPESTLLLNDEGGGAAGGGDAATIGPSAPSAEPGAPDAALDVAARPLAAEEQAEVELNERMAREDAQPHDCNERPTSGPAPQSAVPEIARIGPLTQAQRGRYLLHQVGQSMSRWFRCNAYWVVPALIVAIVAFIAAFILTDGAIVPAALEVMEVLAPLFLGFAVLRITGFVAQYFAQAVSGDTENAAKSLARAFAAAAIEIAFALLFNLKAVIQQAGRAVREVAAGGVAAARRLAGEAVTASGRAIRGTVTGAIEAAGRLRGTVRRGAAAIVENTGRAARFITRGGRALLRGIEEGFARGIRSLRQLFERIREWFRGFKRFRIRFQRFWLIFEGEVNPWITIFEAEIEVFTRRRAGAQFVSEEELDALRRAQGGGSGRIRRYEVAPYRETTIAGRGVRGDRLTGDHIPSRAALEQALLDREAARLNRELTEAEIRAIERQAHQEGVTVVLRDTDHATLSRTYAGRNTAAQIAIDAADLGAAFRNDTEAILRGLEHDGRLTNEIVGAYLEAYRQNVARGIFRPDPAIDRMIQSFIR
jgi:hypothetical protein